VDKEEFKELDEPKLMQGIAITYSGKTYAVTGLDFNKQKIEIYNGGYEWVDIDEIKLVNIGE